LRAHTSRRKLVWKTLPTGRLPSDDPSTSTVLIDPGANPHPIERSILMSLRFPAALVLVVAAAPAQQRTFVPTDSLAVLTVDGPAALRAAFADTNLGKLLASPRISGLFAPVQGMIKLGLRAAERETDADLEGLYEAVLGYRGRLAVAFDLLTDDPDSNDPPPIGAVLVAEPDGVTDLAALCETVRGLVQQQLGPQLAALEAGDLRLTAMALDDGGATLPQVVDGRLVMFFGRPLRQAIDRYAGVRGAPAQRPGNIALHVDGRKLLPLLRAGIRNADDDEAEARIMLAMLDAFGIGNLAALDTSLRAQGAHVVSELLAQFDGEIRGYSGLYVPDRPGRPDLLASIPTDAAIWGGGTFRFDKTLPWVKQLFAAMGGEAPMTFAELEAEFAGQFGLELDKDLAAHLGGSFAGVMQASGLAAMARDDAPDGVCFAVAVKDAAALRKTVQAMLAKGGITPVVTSAGGHDVFQISDPDEDALIEYAFGDQLVALSVGAAGGKLLRRVLAGPAGEPAALPAGVTARLALAPAGWDGIAAFRLPDLLQTILDRGDAPPQAQRVLQILIGALPEFGLEHLVTVSRCGDGRMLQRVIW
jgi:hypothetical protein